MTTEIHLCGGDVEDFLDGGEGLVVEKAVCYDDAEVVAEGSAD